MEAGTNQVIKVNPTGLLKIEKKPIHPALTGRKRQVAHSSRNSVKIFDLIMDDKEEVLIAEIQKMMEEANIVAGFKANQLDKEEKSILIKHFFEVFTTNKAWLTLDEFRLIFKMGINGELTDKNYGFNPPTLTLWIKKYKEIRRDTLIEQMKYEQEIQSQSEEKQRNEQIRKDAIEFQDKFLQMFDDLKTSKDPEHILAEIDPFNAWYGFFTKKGIIKISNDAKIQIKEYVESTIDKPNLIGQNVAERKITLKEHQDKIVRESRKYLFKQEILRMAKEGVDMLQLLIDHEIRIE